MPKEIELSGKSFKAAMMKMFQLAIIINMLETNET